MMRKEKDLRALERELHDLVWYERHQREGIPDGTPPDIVAGANEAAARVEAKYDAAYLERVRTDPWEAGFLNGRLATVRWALGWDDGLLDT
jgi:hypothetical protein